MTKPGVYSPLKADETWVIGFAFLLSNCVVHGNNVNVEISSSSNRNASAPGGPRLRETISWFGLSFAERNDLERVTLLSRRVSG
jgi:hypothetical protein